MASYFSGAGNLNGSDAYMCSDVAGPSSSGSGDLCELSNHVYPEPLATLHQPEEQAALSGTRMSSNNQRNVCTQFTMSKCFPNMQHSSLYHCFMCFYPFYNTGTFQIWLFVTPYWNSTNKKCKADSTVKEYIVSLHC